MLSTSTIKNDPDWEDQIEIKYENIAEYIDVMKEESVDYQEFEIKIEDIVDEELEDLPQECIKDEKDIVGRDYDDEDFDSSIGILGSKDSLEYQGGRYNCNDMTKKENHVIVASNGEDECSAFRNISPSESVSPTSNTSENILKNKVPRKWNRGKHCDFGSPLLSNVKTVSNSKRTRDNIHKCQYCDYVSAYSSALNIHINSKHTRENNSIHKCQFYNYERPLNTNFKNHINSKHTRDNIHQCQYCDYLSAYSSALNIHINSKHTRENNSIHKCQYCDFGSPHSSVLKSHINSKHTRKNIYKCPHCDYESTLKANLTSHVNSKHTRENMHKCQYCDYESSLKANFKIHMNSKHTSEITSIHKCQYCDFGSPYGSERL